MSDNIYGLGDPLLLERIDKLIACGIGTLIDLPQIVVIGDQSSGKSSVLAGLIRKSLPRDSGLCTRFATHIIFRRSQQESIIASITAAADASDEHRTIVGAWQADIPSLDNTNFIRIMAEVHEVMGLRSGIDDSGRPTFSKDVFRLEISGPDQEHLSVIDVPGIFKNTTSGITTKADIELVRNMVLGYMENPRSVMLAVVPANVDVATQEILELASDVDPDGDRTLGVLTKLDLVDKGAEDTVIELVQGKTRHMKLGWHVVRNPGQQHLHEASFDRNALEMDFFRLNSHWKMVDKEKVGIDKLRSRLQEVLSGLVRRESPKVKQETKKRLMIAEKSLLAIGPQRSTSHTQSAFLTDLATRFQRLSMLSLSAKYGIDELFGNSEALRLAPAISERYTIFSDAMENRGHTYAFMKIFEVQETAVMEEWDANTMFDASKLKSKKTKKLEILRLTRSRQDVAEDLAELADLLHGPTCIDDVDDIGMASWLQAVYKTNRGFELGLSAPTSWPRR